MGDEQVPDAVVVPLTKDGTVSQRLVEALEGVARAMGEEPDVEAFGTSRPALAIGLERPGMPGMQEPSGLFCIGYEGANETCTVRIP